MSNSFPSLLEPIEGEYLPHDDEPENVVELCVQVPEILLPLVDRGVYRFVALKGGRGGAKSRTVASILVSLCQQSPLRILCVREVQNSIKDSVKRILDDEIERQGAGSFFKCLDTRIIGRNGTEIIFEGLRHNSDKIKSYEGIDICWAEESHTISQDSMDILEPTIRKNNSEIWYTWNPRFPTDAVQLKFCGPGGPPPRSLVIDINWRDNPWFPDVLYEQMVHMYHTNYQKYLHVYEGHPVGDEGAMVFPVAWIQASVNIELGTDGPWRVGLDVADEGEDANSLTIIKGPTVRSIEEWREGNTTQTTRRAHGACKLLGITRINYDSIGVGAGCKGEFWSLNDLGYSIQANGINVGLPPNEGQWDKGATYKDTFLNLKAELYFRLRRMLKKTFEHTTGVKKWPEDEMISLPNDIDLIAEMSQIHYEVLETGKIKIESKKKMKARGVSSPNKTESVIIAIAPSKTINYLDAL